MKCHEISPVNAGHLATHGEDEKRWNFDPTILILSRYLPFIHTPYIGSIRRFPPQRNTVYVAVKDVTQRVNGETKEKKTIASIYAARNNQSRYQRSQYAGKGDGGGKKRNLIQNANQK